MPNEVWNPTQVKEEATKIEHAAREGQSIRAFQQEDRNIDSSSRDPDVRKANAAAVTAKLEEDGFLPVCEFDLAKNYKDRGFSYCNEAATPFRQRNMEAGQESAGPIEKAIVQKVKQDQNFDAINPNTHERPALPKEKLDVPAAPKSTDLPPGSMEAKMDQMLLMMEAMQKKNDALQKELDELRSGKIKPTPKEADDPAKYLAEAKKLVEETAKREAEAKKAVEAKEQNDPAKKLEEAKKLVEEAAKREAEARKKEAEQNDPAKKLAEARRLVAEDDAKKNAETKAAEAKLAEAKAAEAKAAKAVIDEKLAKEAEKKIELGPYVKSIQATHNEKGELIAKEYEFSNSSYVGAKYKNGALEKFDSKGQVETIEHRYDNGWVFTTRPQDGEKGVVFAQRPAVTQDADPAKYAELSAKYGTTVYKGETYARTRPLPFPGYQQIDRDDLSYPWSVRWNSLNTARTGDW